MGKAAASLFPFPRRCRRVAGDFVTDVDEAAEANLRGVSR
jgi:hypothetical protein